MSDNDAHNDNSNEPTNDDDGTQAPDKGNDEGQSWEDALQQLQGKGLSPEQVIGRLEASRKWEQRAKENYEAAQELQKIKESQKSEEEKQRDRQQQLQTDASEAKAEAARLRVALKKGLTESQAKRLVGNTEEELEADAEELLASFAPDDKSGDELRRVPKERLRPGATSSAPEPDPNELADAVFKATRGGF